eukprot:GSMAST32.ASY1.ANO1.303.1 assembled CDS
MSYLLPHLNSGWAVDQAILTEEERVVVIRFGHDWDKECMIMDEILCHIAEKHIMVDFGTGNNNKCNFQVENKQEMIDIIEVVYRGAVKGRGVVISPKVYSLRDTALM